MEIAGAWCELPIRVINRRETYRRCEGTAKKLAFAIGPGRRVGVDFGRCPVPIGWSQVFLRFVLSRSHPDTGVEEGIFGAAYELRDSALTSLSDRQLLDGLLSWFETNLATPARFNKTKSKGYYRRRTAGVSWLKPTAVEQITRMRELIVILEENGYHVSQITTKMPGYVVFEDDYQVVAEPFRNARK